MAASEQPIDYVRKTADPLSTQEPGPPDETLRYEPETPKGSLTIRCEACQGLFQLAPDFDGASAPCPHCEHAFDLDKREVTTRQAESLRSIGRFDLIERAGQGGFGTVWKGRDKHLDRTVAIKIPRRTHYTKTEIDRVLREARASAQLQHPNIVTIHEIGREGDSLYIVSEFVRGVTLADVLTAGRPSVDVALGWLIPVAEALHHAHEQGVIHRDVKPSNIIIDENDTPQLMDFGLARREYGEETLTVEGQVVGTPAYMSPEQARGDSRVADRRTDVYSLGVVLYELLTGERPFRGNATMQIHQVLHDDPQPPRKLDGAIPRDIETVILKCLEKEPHRRYDTTEQVAQELRRYLEGRPVEARPATLLGKVARWYRRNPRSIEITAGAHGALTAVLFIMWSLHGLMMLSLQNVAVSNPLRAAAEFAMLLTFGYSSMLIAGLATLAGKPWGLWLGLAVGGFGLAVTTHVLLDPAAPVLQLELSHGMNGNRFSELQLYTLLSLLAVISVSLHLAALAMRYSKGKRV